VQFILIGSLPEETEEETEEKSANPGSPIKWLLNYRKASNYNNFNYEQIGIRHQE